MLKSRCGLPARTAPHCLEAGLVLKAAAGCQPARLGSSFLGSFGAQRPLRAASPHCSALLGSSFGALTLRAASPHRSALFGSSSAWEAALVLKGRRLEAALVLKRRCCSKWLPARTAWKHLWCSKATAGCQPAPLGNTFGAQRPLRAASPQFLGDSFGAQTVLIVAGCQPAPLGSSFGSWAVVEAAFGAQRADGCQPAPLGSNSGAPRPVWATARKARRLEAALVIERRCGLPACTAPHCLEAALVLKGRCGLPARAAWKQLSSFRAQGPLQAAASPHRLEAALVLKRRCGLQARAAAHRLEASLVLKRRCGPAPFRSALKQLWCSKAAAGWQSAPLGSNFGAQRPLRAASRHRSALFGMNFGAQRPLQAASPHRSPCLEAALVLKPLRAASAHRLEVTLVLG